MSHAIKEEGLWAAIETTYNTPETLVAGDALEVENLVANPAESAKIIERATVRSSLAPQSHQYGGSLFGFTFDVELKGSGAAGTAPRMGRLLRACGMTETIVAATSVTYQPESDTSLHDSLTLGFREGPNFRTIAGARGTWSLAAASGDRFLISCTMIGHIASEVVAAPPAATFETTLPPIFRGANFTVDGVLTPIADLAVAMGNTMSISPDPNSTDSFGVIRVSARKIEGSINPEAQSIAVQDPIGQFRSAAQFAINTGTVGVATNQLSISLPNVQYRSPSSAEREALRTYELPFSATDTAAGDDDIAIQLT